MTAAPLRSAARGVAAPSERRAPSRHAKRLRYALAVFGTLALAANWITRDTLPDTVLFCLWAIALLCWGAALLQRWPVRRMPAVGRMAGVIAVLLIPRVLWLTQLPYEVTLDEVLFPLHGQEWLRRPMTLLAGGRTVPHFGEALQAWPCLLFSPLLGARLASVVLSIVSLLATYLLTFRLFGRRTALIALIVLGCSSWHLIYSRVGYPYMQPIALVPLILYLCIVGVRQQHRFVQFVAGLAIGLSVVVYVPARIAGPIAALWLLHRVVTRATSWHAAARFVAIASLGAFVVLTPQLERHGSRTIVVRYESVSTGAAAPVGVLRRDGIAPPARALLRNQVAAALRPYVSPGAVMAVGDFSPTPLIDRLTLILAALGIGLCLLRIRDDRYFLLLAWIGATFIFGQVLTDVPSAAYRAAPLLPAVAICVSLVVAAALGWFDHQIARTRMTQRTTLWLGVAAVMLLFLPSNLRAAVRYFQQHAHSAGSDMARFIGSGSDAPAYYVVGRLPSDAVVTFFGGKRTVHDLLNLMDALGTGVINPLRPAVFVIDWRLAAAVSVIQRCYPGAVAMDVTSSVDRPSPALFVPQASVAAGWGCRVPEGGPGLRARYFTGSDWNGTLWRDRLEDWPVRFRQDPARPGSIEWSGYLQIPVAGEYRIQYWGSRASGETTIGDTLRIGMQQLVKLQLEPGFYPLRIRCRPETFKSYCTLIWLPPGGAVRHRSPDLIPPEFLWPSGE